LVDMISLPDSTVFSSAAAVSAAVVAAAVVSAAVAAGASVAVVVLVVLLLPQPANMDMTIRTVSASANTFFIILLSFSFLTSRSWEVIDECIIARILFIVNRMNIQQ